MVKILPQDPVFNDNIGEKKVYDYLKTNLNRGEVCYHNYDIKSNEFDFCIMVPNQGILILEVKSWKSENIIEIKDNLCVKYNVKGNMKYLLSPYKQADKYAKILINELRKRINKDIFVLPLVWYTEISREEYYENRLDILSYEKFTLFKEDLNNGRSFYDKIEQFFNLAIKYYKKVPSYFDSDTLAKSREIFQPIEQIEKENIPITNFIPDKKQNKKQYYSIFKYLPGSQKGNYQETIRKILEHWTYGTKIYVVTNDYKFIQLFSNRLQHRIRELNVGHKFEIKQTSNHILCYNINCYLAKTSIAKKITIIDGEESKLADFEDELKSLNSKCGFNLEQYMVEHSKTNKDIVVKAGAGTGKTYTMISRIMFLIHTEKLNHESLKESISMITFTNEAADQMKEKIKEEIQNYYVLTGDFSYFEMITSVGDMNICTIHSLVLKILRKYSDLIGYGTDLSIVSGIVERRLQLEKALNNVVVESDANKLIEIMEEFDLTLYHFKKVVESLIRKLEDKNVDIFKTDLDLDDSKYRDFNNLIKKVLIESEIKARELLKKNNTIMLSQLIIELNSLYDELANMEPGEPNIRYLFIDEFQDTDNVQIDLISKFKKLFGFTLFIVGDIKQCIYRFRGAEENAFNRLIKDGKDWSEYVLFKNYRTDRRLLNEYDKIFGKWAENNRLPYGEKDKLISSNIFNDLDDDFFRRVRLTRSSGEEFEQRLVDEINLQKDKLDNVRANETDLQKHKPNDKKIIAILVRENKEAEVIINIGKKYGIDIESGSTGDLYKIEPTRDLYKLVLALQNSRSPKHLINLYDTNYINENIDVKGMFKCRGNQEALYRLIMAGWPIRGWETYLNNLKKDTVLKVLREIVKELRPWDNYSTKYKDVEKQRLFYRNNLDLLFEQLTKGRKTDYLTLNKIQEFLSIMITTGQKVETRNEFCETDNIDIICGTVHGAKGLEFDTVILPFTDLNLADTKKSGEYDFIIFDSEIDSVVKVGYKIKRYSSTKATKSNSYYSDELAGEKEYRLKEETRILYVALTRAKRNLVIFEYPDNKNKNTWQSYLQ